MFQNFVAHVNDFVQAHAAWAPFIVGLLAFCESLAIVSFFVPATVILIAIGGMIGPANLSFWALWAAAAVGAILGDWLSYFVGRFFERELINSSFYKNHRDRMERAFRFMRKWGAGGVFVGRFSGPLRAFVPLVAGLLDIPQLQFQIANITSAMVWAALVLSPGTMLGKWLPQF